MNILVWQGKHDPRYWLAEGREQEEAAYQAMVLSIDAYGYYWEYEDESAEPSHWQAIHALALSFEPLAHAAAKMLVGHRRDHEYEGLHIERVTDPLEE